MRLCSRRQVKQAVSVRPHIRYSLGIALTFFIGRQAIVALNCYLEEQAEALPDARRRQDRVWLTNHYRI